jgi:hypothetical protein
MSRLAVLSGAINSNRPPAVPQPPLPPFEASDTWGVVHTTPPPELQIPAGALKDFFRGDLGGVTLAIAPPYVPGANTTPPEMTMSFLLPWYERHWIDVILRAHAERGYTHFTLDRWQADRAGFSLSQFANLVAYVQSWGFYTPIWLSGANDDRTQGWRSVGPVISAALDALLTTPTVADNLIALPGEELNNGCPPGPEGADGIIFNVAGRCWHSGVPTWLHFTSNYPGYPPPPPDGNIDAALVTWWQQWEGLVAGLCWQGNQNDSAGLMGAKMYDSRRILHRAGDFFKLVAFELLATNQLYGRATEEQGCLRSLEMLYCPQGETTQMVWGYGNGCRQPNGDAL